MVEPQLLLRPDEAAKALAVSRSRVYALLANGELRSVKIGASRRVPTAELRAFVRRLNEFGGREGESVDMGNDRAS